MNNVVGRFSYWKSGLLTMEGDDIPGSPSVSDDTLVTGIGQLNDYDLSLIHI